MIESIKKLFQRELTKLKIEIAQYQHEPNIWLVEASIANSAGNLCLHLIGNLNTFIGAQFGNTGYVRQRELEFSSKDIPRETLIENIEATMLVVENALSTLTPEDLQKEYPRKVLEEMVSTEYFLIHLVMHLAYHLGQINYHRRLLDK
ncbi:MAG: DUF1572 domain-containing protein [Bacteroidetes bacterium]|nr:MAG: DUF1572 domain-containing protein [Bacteroidota bacterium]